jgi:hypothetical protein
LANYSTIVNELLLQSQQHSVVLIELIMPPRLTDSALRNIISHDSFICMRQHGSFIPQPERTAF